MKKKIFAILFCVLMLVPFTISAFAENSQTKLKFDENGKFKILMVADTQDTDNPNDAMIELLEKSLETAEPDLVVFTGDNVHGTSVKTEEAMKKAIDAIISPVVERDIPFAIVFGNHDDEGGVSKEFQMKVYQSHPNCLSVGGEDITGYGNYNLLVNDSKNEKAVLNLWMIDSGTYSKDGGYAYVETDQIQWYEKTSNALKKANNGKALPSLLFQHIPVCEMYDLLEETDKNTENAVNGFSSHSDKYYILDSTKVTVGTMGEGPCSPDYNNGQFASWVKQGDILGAFFGHDHVNDFSGTLDGINLTYCAGAGFYIYGKGEYHGTRVIELDENDLTTYATEMLYYGDMVEKDQFPSKLVMTKGVYYLSIVAKVLVSAILVFSVITVGTVAIVKKVKKKKSK